MADLSQCGFVERNIQHVYHDHGSLAVVVVGHRSARLGRICIAPARLELATRWWLRHRQNPRIIDYCVGDLVGWHRACLELWSSRGMGIGAVVGSCRRSKLVA